MNDETCIYPRISNQYLIFHASWNKTPRSSPVIFLPDLLAAAADPQGPFTAKKQHKAVHFVVKQTRALELDLPRFNFVHN